MRVGELRVLRLPGEDGGTFDQGGDRKQAGERLEVKIGLGDKLDTGFLCWRDSWVSLLAKTCPS